MELRLWLWLVCWWSAGCGCGGSAEWFEVYCCGCFVDGVVVVVGPLMDGGRLPRVLWLVCRWSGGCGCSESVDGSRKIVVVVAIGL